MKGIIFSEFVEMVEAAFSPEIADQIIEQSELASEGAYTSVGTYDHREILKLVGNLSEATSIPVDELIITFGRHMFGRFYVLYPFIFENISSAFDFLELIEDHVHAEVRKLYNDTELPTFETLRPDDATLIMTYKSKRPLATMAQGLIQGCIDHYGENISMEIENLSSDETSHVRFTLRHS
jgi:hypothetical protein